MLKAFSKIGYDVELTFPNRAKNKISRKYLRFLQHKRENFFDFKILFTF